MASSLTDFERTAHGSEAYRRAATSRSSGATLAAGTSPAARHAVPNSEVTGLGGAGGGGRGEATKTSGGVSGGEGLSKSGRKSLFDKFGSPGKVLPEGVPGWTGGKGSGEGGGSGVQQRRATHDGVAESGDLGLRVEMMHFRPEEFMDPDTAAQVCTLRLTQPTICMFLDMGEATHAVQCASIPLAYRSTALTNMSNLMGKFAVSAQSVTC